MARPPLPRATWLPFAVCILLTTTAALAVAQAERRADAVRFTSDVAAVRARIDERMASYLAVLRAASGLWATRHQVTPDEFRVFVERLRLPEHYPGTQGIGYSANFGKVDVGAATAAARAKGWADIGIWPGDPRDEIHAIVLLEPDNPRNRAPLGFDMRTETTRRIAMDRARDDAVITMTRRVTLVQEIDEQKQPGFLLYSPIYAGGGIPATVEERRDRLTGHVFAPLRAGDLFEGIFHGEQLPVTFEIYDGREPDGALLYALGPPIAPGDSVVVHSFTFAHNEWTGRFASCAPSTILPLTVVVSALGVLLSGVVLASTVARERGRDREVRAVGAALASEEAIRLKDTFIGILGHDLRGPLNSLSLTTQVLLRRASGDQDTTQMLERMQSSIARMSRMIGQILDLARARLGGGIRLAPKEADLGTLVHAIADEVMRGNPTCAIAVETFDTLKGTWDPDRLEQVLSNLLGNAARYHLGAPVTVKADGGARDCVVVTVHNAATIPVAQLPQLFQPFHASDAASRARGGLGLGLYIARVIVEAHGGTIEVTSREPEGTTFTVLLPRTCPL